jgi:hypothetical protein
MCFFEREAGAVFALRLPDGAGVDAWLLAPASSTTRRLQCRAISSQDNLIDLTLTIV